MQKPDDDRLVHIFHPTFTAFFVCGRRRRETHRGTRDIEEGKFPTCLGCYAAPPNWARP